MATGDSLFFLLTHEWVAASTNYTFSHVLYCAISDAFSMAKLPCSDSIWSVDGIMD